jgi:hypothetical protein
MQYNITFLLYFQLFYYRLSRKMNNCVYLTYESKSWFGAYHRRNKGAVRYLVVTHITNIKWIDLLIGKIYTLNNANLIKKRKPYPIWKLKKYEQNLHLQSKYSLLLNMTLKLFCFDSLENDTLHIHKLLSLLLRTHVTYHKKIIFVSLWLYSHLSQVI